MKNSIKQAHKMLYRMHGIHVPRDTEAKKATASAEEEREAGFGRKGR